MQSAVCGQHVNPHAMREEAWCFLRDQPVCAACHLSREPCMQGLSMHASFEHVSAQGPHKAGQEGALPLLLLTVPFNTAQGWAFFHCAGAGHGPDQHSGAPGAAAGGDEYLVPGDSEEQPHSSQSAQGSAQRSCASAFTAVHIMCTMFTYHASEQRKRSFSCFSIVLHKDCSSN